MDVTSVDESVLQQLSLPTRRDYQLRSYSVKANDKRRGPLASDLLGQGPTFHLHQDEFPLEKSFLSGPLFSNISTEKVNSLNGFTSFHRRQWSEGSLPGTPELGSSPGASFPEEEHHQSDKGQSCIQTGDENQAPNTADTCTRPIYSSRDTYSLRIAKPKQRWSSRNCVSGEMSLGFNLPPAERSRTARRCVSGQLDSSHGISGAAGYHGLTSESGAKPQQEKWVKATGDTKRRPSASIAWDALNEPRLDGPGRGNSMAAIPFKWEEAPGKSRELSKKEFLRASSFQSEKDEQASALEESSFRGSHRYYEQPNTKDVISSRLAQSESGKWEEGTSDLNPIAQAPAKFLKDVAPTHPSPAKVVPVAVPFKWEEVPGKPKVNDTSVPEVTPSLQLPPRLVSTSQKQEKSSSRKALVSRVHHTNCSLSAPFAVLYPDVDEFVPPTLKGTKHSSRKEDVHMCSSSPFSGPLESIRPGKHLQAWRGPSGALSGPISNSSYGLPHYHQSVELCDSGEAWREMQQMGRPANAAWSPTSILCGPMSDGHTSYSTSSPVSDINIHSNALYNSQSNSQSSTSRDSFDHWSSGDHTSPMTRLPANVQSESILGSPYRGPTADDNSNNVKGGAIMKLCRAGSQWKKSRSKSKKVALVSSKEWPSNLVTYPTFVTCPPSLDLDGCSSHGDTFYDCHGSSSSSPLPNHNVRTELSSPVARTRLPYTMPAVTEPDPDDPNPSTKNLREFSNCLGVPLTLPRFLSRCETVGDVDPYFWVENPSWAPPSSYLEDGYRSPAYQATLELLSPSQELMTRSRGSRRSQILKLSGSSLRKAQIVEVMCSSLRQMLLRYAKRSSCQRTNSWSIRDDQFSKRIHGPTVW